MYLFPITCALWCSLMCLSPTRLPAHICPITCAYLPICPNDSAFSIRLPVPRPSSIPIPCASFPYTHPLIAYLFPQLPVLFRFLCVSYCLLISFVLNPSIGHLLPHPLCSVAPLFALFAIKLMALILPFPVFHPRPSLPPLVSPWKQSVTLNLELQRVPRPLQTPVP